MPVLSTGRKLKIAALVPKMASFGNKDLVLAYVVQANNFRDLPALATLARDWGAAINFSTYNALRRGKTEMLISGENDLRELTAVVDRLVAMQRDGYPFLTSEWTMRRMIDFFRTGGAPKCQAGRRFMIVNPWGKLTPCGMCRDHYDDPRQLVEAFTRTNQSNECYTAIRANSEKTPYRLMVDALRAARN